MTNLFETILGQAGVYDYKPCLCIGPQNGEPHCPCRMRNEKRVLINAETGTPDSSRVGARAHLPGVHIAFTVPGQPVAKGRPIAGRVGNRITMRTPSKTAVYELHVAMSASAAMKSMNPLQGPLKVDIDMRVMIPASWSKKKQEEARAGIVRPTKKPDLDNVVKGICDGMNGVAYDDDSQIVEMVVRKTYSDAPCVRVMVQVLEGRTA